MDRFTVKYTRSQAVAVQDRITGHLYDSANFDSLCDLLNNLNDGIDEITKDWIEERQILERQLDELEANMRDTERQTDDLVDSLCAQIEDLENQLAELQPQEQSA